MDESIYNLVPVEYVVHKKPPMHRSTKKPEVIVQNSTFGCFGSTRLPGAGHVPKKEGAMFGPSKLPPRSMSPISSPNKSPKKGQPFKYEDKVKGPVPKKDEKPVMGIRTTKNFVTANAVEAILQVPRVIEQGELNYFKKEDFGKIPAYLSGVKEEIRRENEMISKYVKEQMGEIEEEPEQFEELTDDERYELISALKEKWANVNASYQKITHLVQLDTTGQIRRKETLEKELDIIEKDIEKLQKPGPILIRK